MPGRPFGSPVVLEAAPGAVEAEAQKKRPAAAGAVLKGSGLDERSEALDAPGSAPNATAHAPGSPEVPEEEQLSRAVAPPQAERNSTRTAEAGSARDAAEASPGHWPHFRRQRRPG